MAKADDSISMIDKAIAAANARKAAKAALNGEGGSAPAMGTKQASSKVGNTQTDEAKAEAKRAKDAERALKREQLNKERAERQEKRKTEREAKKAERMTKQSSKVPHMGKVEKAGARLPELTPAAQELINEATANFTATQLAAIALHIQHFNRTKATERALSGPELTEGTIVKIIAGDPKFIGMVGFLSKVQRIRCYVSVDGIDRDIYLFRSDVEAVDVPANTVPVMEEEGTEEQQATGTDG